MLKSENLPKITIIVPCFNEEQNLPKVITKISEYISINACYVIFVNDGSMDATKEILESIANPKIKILNHSMNRGYGGAIKSGIDACVTKYCVTIDGDGQHDLMDIDKLLKVMEVEDADLVVGNRGGRGSTNFRNFGKWIIKKITAAFIEMPIRDLNSGMKFYKTKIVQSLLKWTPNDMSYSEIITLLHSHFRYKVVECEINIFNREAGESTINYKTAIRTVKEILFIIINFFPFRFFGYIGGFLIFIGAVWSIPFLLAGKGLTIGAGFLLSFGLLVILQGVILQTLTRFKFETYKYMNV